MDYITIHEITFEPKRETIDRKRIILDTKKNLHKPDRHVRKLQQNKQNILTVNIISIAFSAAHSPKTGGLRVHRNKRSRVVLGFER